MIINNLEDTKKFAINLANNTKPGTTYALIGDLASGKTTFTKYFINNFDNDAEVISPTFNIVKTYDLNDNKINHINHFDVYRIKNEDELLEIGFYDYINDIKAINIIEWADLIYEKLPDNTIFIRFKNLSDKNKREITIDGK